MSRKDLCLRTTGIFRLLLQLKRSLKQRKCEMVAGINQSRNLACALALSEGVMKGIRL